MRPLVDSTTGESISVPASIPTVGESVVGGAMTMAPVAAGVGVGLGAWSLVVCLLAGVGPYLVWLHGRLRVRDVERAGRMALAPPVRFSERDLEGR